MLASLLSTFMDALTQLRLAVSSARSAQLKAQSELAQASCDLQKWESREKAVAEIVDKPNLIEEATFRKLVSQERVRTLTSLVEANAETISRLEKQLASWEATKLPKKPKQGPESVDLASRAVPSSLKQHFQDRQDALDKKINKLTAQLFEVQQEFQTLKKDMEKTLLAEDEETFLDQELEKLKILLDEL
jgi:hypothetical protein